MRHSGFPLLSLAALVITCAGWISCSNSDLQNAALDIDQQTDVQSAAQAAAVAGPSAASAESTFTIQDYAHMALEVLAPPIGLLVVGLLFAWRYFRTARVSSAGIPATTLMWVTITDQRASVNSTGDRKPWHRLQVWA